MTLARLLALARRHPEAGLLHHSDCGSEFTSNGYQELLAEVRIEVSMSRTGNCYDNAAQEADESMVGIFLRDNSLYP